MGRIFAAASTLALMLVLVLPEGARAQQGIALDSAGLEVRDAPDPGLYLDAQFDLEPSAAIEEAIQHGVPVYFSIDFELVRTRWYWFDRHLASTSLTYRLSYSPLTREYRLSRGALAQRFESLSEALATVRTVRSWKVAARGAADSLEHLVARVRLRLDTTMLPKPFQVDSLTNREWALTSGWQPVHIGASPAH